MDEYESCAWMRSAGSGHAHLGIQAGGQWVYAACARMHAVCLCV